MSPEIAARLESLEIHLAAQTKGYCLFVRGECIALAEPGPPPSIGSTGMMTENGLSYLIWREGVPILAAHGGKETQATPDQTASIAKFTQDLKQALSSSVSSVSLW